MLLEEKIKKIKLVAFDFDGVFTDNMVYVQENGLESVRCSRSDGMGLKKLATLNIDTCIISTEKNPVVLVRSKKLGISCEYNCNDKKAKLAEIINEKGITLDEVAFVGNDINDVSCLKIVGLPIVVNDAHPDVMRFADLVTKAKGGHGAVREICDLIEKSYSSERQ